MSKAEKSVTQKQLPFRSGAQPRCGHFPCQFKAQSLLKKMKQEHAAADPQGITKISLDTNKWLGPAGVATIFFKHITIPSNHAAVTNGFARIASLNALHNNSSSPASAAPPPPPTTTATTTTPIPLQEVPALAVLVGFDKHRNMWSICSGTMSDSWAKDQGCAADAALRESHEEFKFDFRDKNELLELSKKHWWWEANTVCFGINLSDLHPPQDPRADIEYLKSRIDEALKSNSTPMCEREILSLAWFVIPKPATSDVCTNSSKKKKIEVSVGITGFGLICVEKLRRKLFGASSSAVSPADAVSSVAAADTKTEEVKQERESTPEKK